MNKKAYQFKKKQKNVKDLSKAVWQWNLLFFMVIFFSVFPLFSQEEKESSNVFRWEISLGGVSYYVSSANNWNFGPELIVQHALSETFGIYASISYPSVRMTSRGYGFREGFPVDGGIWVCTRSVNPQIKLGGGLSHIFGSDSDGSQINNFGAHISTHVAYWFKPHIGIWARGVLRLWLGDRHSDSRSSPSFSAGVGFRF